MKRKKLVFVLNNFLIGGTERLILEILKNFDRNEFDMRIITVMGSGSMELDFSKLEIPIFFAGSKKYPSSSFLKVIWILSIPFIFLRLIISFRKSSPDIVVTSLYAADVLGIFTAWLCGIRKRIIIYHDIHKMSTTRWILRKIFALNLANKIIAVSSNVKFFLINYWGVSSDKVIIIFNGIDFQKFELGKKFLGPTLVLGFIGRLALVKDPKCLLKALVILKNKYRLNPEVIMIGSGELESSLKEFVCHNNISNIQFTGWTDDIIKWLKKIDILIAPSREEGLPLTVLEALVSNKIVIASDIEPMKELISSGNNGILFKVGNADSLSKKLKDLLVDSTLVKNYYDNVSQWVNKNKHLFDIKDVVKRYSEILNLDN